MAEFSGAHNPTQYFLTFYSIQEAVTYAITNLRELDFQTCYVAWKIRRTNIFCVRGISFEGDKVDLDK
jgi:hypothetical protein